MSKESSSNSSRIHLRVTQETMSYLAELAKIGIHGKNRTEVAKTLVSNGIERLIREGFLKLHSLPNRK